MPESADGGTDNIDVGQDHGLLTDISSSPDSSSHAIHRNEHAEISSRDRGSLMMLFGLHFVHAIPLAFSWSTMPVLLRQQASYLAVGSFVLTQYPYTLKALWSPMIGHLYLPWLGDKKSWLIPSYLVNALCMYLLALHQDQSIRDIAAGSSSALIWFSAIWLLINFFCANIRIALDAWSLELVSPQNLNWYGAVVTIAEGLGTFVTFNLFLGLAPESSDQHEFASVHGFFSFAALVSLVTACLLLLKRETRLKPRLSLADAYGVMLRILRLRQVWTLFAVHMISLVGFVTNDTVTTLQFVKNGFTDRDLALIATISFPLIAFTSVVASRVFRTRHPLQVWRITFPFRLAAAVLAQACVAMIYTFRKHTWRWYLAILPSTITPMLEAVMYVCVMTYHAEVSDPRHGAVYLSLLAITLELRYTVLQYLSTEAIGILDGGEDALQATRLIDGYQMVNAASVLAALPLFWFFLRPATIWLQTQHKDHWRVETHEDDQHVPLSELSP